MSSVPPLLDIDMEEDCLDGLGEAEPRTLSFFFFFGISPFLK
jgi:hypothetical protein